MTTTYNPLRARVPISPWTKLTALPVPEPGSAFVLTGGSIRWTALWPGDRRKARELRWSQFKTLYEVDTRPHTISFSCLLPTKDDEFEYQAEVEGICRALNPVSVLEQNVSDACAVLSPVMVQTMRMISRSYEIGQRGLAERVLVAALKKRDIKLYGLELQDVSVRLSLAEEEHQHLRALRQIKRDLVFEERIAELLKKREENGIALHRLSLEFYNELLKKGYGQPVLLYLAQHPSELQSVCESLATQQQSDRRHWLNAFKALKDLDVFEEPHLQEARTFVMQHFTERERQELTIPTANQTSTP